MIVFNLHGLQFRITTLQAGNKLKIYYYYYSNDLIHLHALT